MEIKFELLRETKNKLLFKAVSDTAAIDTIYVLKSALPALNYKQGDYLVVTITKEENQ